MGTSERALTGAASGLGATIVLSGLREVLRGLGLIYKTAPMQVVDRLEESALIKDLSPAAKQASSLAAHFGYGTAAGAVFGILRGERCQPATELSVGVALGVLLWGVGWAGWLPILGVQRAPWHQRTSRVALLPIADHATFGAAWGLLRRLLTREQR